MQKPRKIRPPTPDEINLIIKTSDAIGGPQIVVGTELVDVAQTRLRVVEQARNVVAWSSIGLADDGTAEMIGLLALEPRQGHGRSLWVDAVAFARGLNAPALVVRTSNANLGAQAFYRAMGCQHVATHEGAVADIKRLKGLDPETRLFGDDGIEIRDMEQFRLALL